MLLHENLLALITACLISTQFRGNSRHVLVFNADKTKQDSNLPVLNGRLAVSL